ncbi:MAG TPA: hypothetical protein VGQ59_15530 [Cyclobacteriaceae bacterium]|jgi:hypothetical protein|nr:hypothetical protein [Cyclobacteriaceae bacterium]
MNILRIFINLFRFDRANWKVVSLCVLTAIVFWIFNAFNKNYSTNVRFPLLFEFDGEKYAPAEHLPKNVNLNVTGNGWDLFRRHLGVKVPPVIIPLERAKEIKKIVGSTLPPMLATQVGNLKINYVVTDTIYLQIDERDAHRYKLAADISGVTFREGYGRISPVVILPDSIELDGPQSRLHALDDSIVLVLNDKNISGNFRTEAEVEFPGSEFVKRNPPVVQIMFEVSQVVSVKKNLKVVVVTKNFRKEMADSVEALFQIPLGREEDFKMQSLEILSEVRASQLKKFHVTLPKVVNIPPYALLLKVDSVHESLPILP